jgi:LysR family transcriptional regulator AphB
LLRALQQATQALDATQHSVSGLVRLLAPINLAGGVFRSCLSGFLQAYPEVRLDLKLSNLQEDLLGSGADLALRTGEQPDSGLHQRRLGTVRFVLVAAPAYLRAHGAPVTPADLTANRLTVAEPMTTWRLQHRTSNATFALAAEGRCQVNELALAVHMAREGLGILCCPLTMCHQELQDGTLQEILPEWQAEARAIYAVWPQQRYLPARVRALLDHLHRFAHDQPLLNPP